MTKKRDGIIFDANFYPRPIEDIVDDMVDAARHDGYSQCPRCRQWIEEINQVCIGLTDADGEPVGEECIGSPPPESVVYGTPESDE